MLIRLRVFARGARSQPAALTGLVPSSRQLCLPVTWLRINVCECVRVRAETNYSTSPAHVSAVTLGRLQRESTRKREQKVFWCKMFSLISAALLRAGQTVYSPSSHWFASRRHTHTQEITLAYRSEKKNHFFAIFPGNNFRSAISFKHSPGTESPLRIFPKARREFQLSHSLQSESVRLIPDEILTFFSKGIS